MTSPTVAAIRNPLLPAPLQRDRVPVRNAGHATVVTDNLPGCCLREVHRFWQLTAGEVAFAAPQIQLHIGEFSLIAARVRVEADGVKPVAKVVNTSGVVAVLKEDDLPRNGGAVL